MSDGSKNTLSSGTTWGKKTDGRGDWWSTDQTAGRYSIEEDAEGNIKEHRVLTDRATGEETKTDKTTPSSDL